MLKNLLKKKIFCLVGLLCILYFLLKMESYFFVDLNTAFLYNYMLKYSITLFFLSFFYSSITLMPMELVYMLGNLMIFYYKVVLLPFMFWFFFMLELLVVILMMFLLIY